MSTHHMVMIKDVIGGRLFIKSMVVSLNNPLQVTFSSSYGNQSSWIYNTVNIRMDSAKTISQTQGSSGISLFCTAIHDSCSNWIFLKCLKEDESRKWAGNRQAFFKNKPTNVAHLVASWLLWIIFAWIFYTKEILSQWHKDIHCSMAYNHEKWETNIYLQKEG